MEYKKIINLLDNAPNQPSKFRTKNWVLINDDARGSYNKNSQGKFKTSMLKSSLCDYSDTYVVITTDGTGVHDTEKWLEERNKGVIFKNWAPFTDCISEINNTQIENAKELDVVMPINKLIEYSNNYLKTSGSFLQYYRDNSDDNIVNSDSFKFKIQVTGKTPAAGNIKDVKIALPLKHLSNFWGTLEIPLINCEINPILTWPDNCVIFSATGKTRVLWMSL